MHTSGRSKSCPKIITKAEEERGWEMQVGCKENVWLEPRHEDPSIDCLETVGTILEKVGWEEKEGAAICER